MHSRQLYLEALLVALATLLLEVSFTRVFSFKLIYYFTYLIIGIAMLGLGAGGVFVAIFPRLRRIPVERLLPSLCLAAAASALGGYFVVALMPLNLFALVAWATPPGVFAAEIGKLVIVCLVLFVPFVCAGFVLAIIFATQTEHIAKLYFADLVGAAIACALVIPLLATIGPPGAVMLAGAVFAAAGLRLALVGSRALALLLAVTALPLLVFAIAPSRLPDPVTDQVKTLAANEQGVRPTALLSRWSPVFRVDALESVGSIMLVHDGMVGSFLHPYSGDRNSLSRFDALEQQIPFRLLPPGPRVAIVGAAGGQEILASLWFEASHVTGVELNPVIWSLVTRHLADYGGHLAELPNVDYVNAEGRSFLNGNAQTYDLIWLVAPDSYAAMNAASSGAFVLSESYLYTEEMIHDNLEQLTAQGLICVQFGEGDYLRRPNRTLRYLVTARAALRRLGIENFGDHVLVATSLGYDKQALVTVLLSKAPFDAERRATFATTVRERVRGGLVRYDGTRGGKKLIDQVILRRDEGLAAWLAAYPYEVGAIYDDSPFFWHFVSFRNALASITDVSFRNVEEGTGERLLLILLVIAVGFAAVFLLAPLLVRRSVWREIPYKAWPVSTLPRSAPASCSSRSA